MCWKRLINKRYTLSGRCLEVNRRYYDRWNMHKGSTPFVEATRKLITRFIFNPFRTTFLHPILFPSARLRRAVHTAGLRSPPLCHPLYNSRYNTKKRSPYQHGEPGCFSMSHTADTIAFWNTTNTTDGILPVEYYRYYAFFSKTLFFYDFFYFIQADVNTYQTMFVGYCDFVHP